MSAVFVSSGQLSVDAGEALAKLREHRLADPHHWVLDVLRAAALSGAARVTVRTDADDVEIEFDGKPFPPEVLREIFGHALQAGKSEEAARFRLLALGVTGALAMRPRWIDVHGSGVALRVKPPDRLAVEPAETGPGTRVHARDRVSWRVVKRAVSASPEAALIAERAAHFPAELVLNGERIDGEPSFPGSLATRTVAAGSLELRAAVLLEPLEHSRVEIDVHGVTVITRSVRLPGLQIAAWARDAGLRRNASGSDVVEDDPVWVRLLAHLEGCADELLAAVAGDERARPALIRAALGASAKPRQRKLSPRARALLDEARLLPGPSGERISVAELRAEIDRGRPIRVASKPYPAELYEPPVVYLERPGSELRALLPPGRVVDIDDEVETRRRWQERKQRFLAQPEEALELPGLRRWLASARVDRDGVAGVVGVPDQAHATTARLLYRRRLVELRELPALAPLRVHAVLDSERFVPNASWDGVSGQGASELAPAILEGVTLALTEALASPGEPPEALRAHARELVAHLAGPEGRGLAELPPALRAAPIYALAGGGWTSLDEIGGWDACRWVRGGWNHPALDGKPVVALEERDHGLLGLVAPPALDVGPRLERELQVRRRMAAPRVAPRLGECWARVPVTGEGMRGEVGLAVEAQRDLRLALLRDGLLLETVETAARYRAADAVVDCAELSPDEEWTGVRRDAVYERVLAAVKEGELRLVGEILGRFGEAGPARLPEAVRQVLFAFARRELEGAGTRADRLSELEGRVFRAPLLGGLGGPLSLADLVRAAEDDELWTLDPVAPRPPAPQGMLVVVADEGTRALLHTVLLRAPRDALRELERRARRAEFDAQPAGEARLPEGMLKVPFKGTHFEGELGHAPGWDAGLRLTALFEGRPLCRDTRTARVSLEAVIETRRAGGDPTERALAPSVARELDAAAKGALKRLLERALDEPAQPACRAFLLEAVGRRLHDKLPRALAARLRGAPLFPVVAGEPASADHLASRPRLCLVTTPFEVSLQSGEPVVLAVDPAVRAALEAFTGLVDVGAELAAEIDARHAFERRREEAIVPEGGHFLGRRVFRRDDLDGQVALGGGGQISFFVERRRVVSEALLPVGAAAAVNCDALTLTSKRDGVIDDAARRRAVHAVEEELEVILAETAGDPFPLFPWLAGLSGWLLARKRIDHPLLAVRFLDAADGGELLSVRELLELAKREGAVLHAASDGALLEPERRVWRPRPGELEALALPDLELREVGELLERAGELRRRPPLTSLAVPFVTTWREAVSGPALAGEAAIASSVPTGSLELDLVVDGRLIETLLIPHPIGGLARASSPDLRLDDDLRRVRVDAALARVRLAAQEALDRLVLSFLERGRREPGWPAHAAAAARAWKERLEHLPLFVEVGGRALSPAQLRGRRVAVIEEGLAPPPGSAPALALGPGDAELLALLGIESDDRSDEARRLAEREQRRLAGLGYRGDALVRLAIDPAAGGDWSGELVLPWPIDEGAAIQLARDGVAVERFALPRLGVAGVLDHPALPVDERWQKALLGVGETSFLSERVDALFGRLADEHPPRLQGAAARYALRYLAHRGVTDPRHLDRLAGTVDRLARAKLFQTSDGRWIDLRSIADRLLRRGAVPILGESLAPDEAAGDVVLLGGPWLEDLRAVLGGGETLVVVDGKRGWRALQAEVDPDPGTPLHAGLTRLRREAHLLRAGALGVLDPRELTDVRLRRRGGKTAVQYDAERGVVFVDPDHAGVRHALESAARPDLVYVLLASIYGAINRALDRVTDDDEARLTGALLSHLSSNPGLLSPEIGELAGPRDREVEG